MESIGAYVAPILSARIGRQREERERRRAEEALDAMLNSTTEIALLLSASGSILEVNQAGANFLGMARRDIQGRPIFDFIPEDISELRAEKCTTVSDTLEPEHWRDQQGDRIFENTAYPVIVDGEAERIALFMQDITQRIHAEEQLQKHSEALEAANKELQHFAYVASHDLREPLRKMSNFAGLLGRRYTGQLDERADRYINYVVDAAMRMQGLIDDLLLYSRAGRMELIKERVDTEEMLERIINDLEPQLVAASAQVTHDELPVVDAHVSQLGQLFQNLLTNAVKFRSARDPRIHVSCEKSKPGWTFCVRDNGIGIDPEQFERVFGIFQRLHNREEYPGTGIGLAVCKKIVERHGGRIWVESAPEEGSKFFFTVPVGSKD